MRARSFRPRGSPLRYTRPLYAGAPEEEREAVSDDFTFEHRREEAAGGASASVIRVGGKIGSTTVGQIEEEANELFLRGHRHLIFDCSSVEYLNSTGAGLLIKLMDRFAGEGGSVQLVSLAPAARSTLDILGLIDVFLIKDSVEEALAEI